MSKNIIFHFPLPLDINSTSASGIRPQKMYNAFKKIGYNIDLISGTGQERKKKIEGVKKKLNNNIKYDFLYSESSTMPTLLTEDHHLPTYPFLDFSFFKFIKKHNIKIGLFYRDVYWNFDNLYDINIFKKVIGRMFYYYDLFKYNQLLDRLYLPSLEMDKFIPYELEMPKSNLPPGVNDIKKMPYEIDDEINIFYVGGIGENYNMRKLFQAVRQLSFVNLTICTRESEWNKNRDKYNNLLSDNIKIIHKNSDELIPHYKNAHISSLFVKKSDYRSFSMPYKLFEYLEMQRPIIGVSGNTASDFIDENNIGWSINYSVNEFVDLLKYLKNNKNEIYTKQKNMLKVAKKNSWLNRAKKVKKDLA